MAPLLRNFRCSCVARRRFKADELGLEPTRLDRTVDDSGHDLMHKTG